MKFDIVGAKILTRHVQRTAARCKTPSSQAIEFEVCGTKKITKKVT